MNLLRFVSALLLLSVSAFGQAVDYRALGTNSYYTNGLRVNDKHWTNSAGLYRYQPLTGTVAAGQPGPPLVLRSDGSAFVGTNVFQDVAPTASGIFFPYVISMTDSNEPTTVNADWWAIDSENYGVYGGASLDVQQAGSSLFRLSADTGPSSTLLRLNSTPGASDILLNENTDRFLASANATNVVMANAVGQNWILNGRTNGTDTIRVRADGSTFVGKGVGEEWNLNDFSSLRFATVASAQSNEAATVSIDGLAFDSESSFSYWAEHHLRSSGDKDLGSAFLILGAHLTNGNDTTITLNADPATPNISGSAISLQRSVLRFSVDQIGDIKTIKSLTYSWPTARGGANSVLTDTDNAGTLAWTPVGSGGIGPGTNTFLAMFNSTGTNVHNSPLKSPFTNSLEAFLLPTGGTFTNGATTNRMYAMWAHAGTNSYLEFVSPPPFANQVAHIRAQTTGFTSQRPAIYLNDSVVVEPVDNQLGGHAAGALHPIVSGLGTLGTPVLLWHGVYSDTNGFAAQARNDQVLFSDGAAKGFGISTAGALYFTGPAFVGIQFNQDKTTGSPQFDLGASQLGFGSSISNSIAQLQESTLVGYVQAGTNNANTATARAQGFIGARASGTDRPGSDLVLSGGMSTGTGTSGNVRLQTVEPGTTGSGLNSSIKDRMFVIAKPITLTTNSATIVANLTIPTALRGVGGTVIAHTEIENGVDIATTDETFTFTANRKGSTVVTGISAPITCTSSSGGSAAIANTWTAVANSTSVDLKLTCVTSGILSTNSTVRVTIIPNSSAVPVITHP